MSAFSKPAIGIFEFDVNDILTTAGDVTPTESTAKPGPIIPELSEELPD